MAAAQKVGSYTLTRKLLPGDITRGAPELWEAQDAGDLYFIKIWRRRPAETTEFRAMWNREVRALTRLQGYPGAAELFVKLRDLDATEKQFYAVLDGGTRVLLSTVLQNRPQYPWLLNLAEVGRRRSIWEGLLRTAEAISILHSEGTLHRSISSSAIFVSPQGNGDFRLSGFEWSLRLAGPEGASARVGHKGNTVKAPELDRTEKEYSPATDWFDFGIVAAQTLGANFGSTTKRDGARSVIRTLSSLRDKEKQLLLQLLEENPEQRLATAEAVTQAIRTIIYDLNIATAGAGRALVVAVRFAPELDLQQIVQSASQGAAPSGDSIKQIEWIRQDLRGDIRIIARTSPYPHYVLKGERLEYRIRPWTVGGNITWDIGFCESIESLPRVTSDDQHFSLGQRKLDLQLFPQVRKNQRSIRDRSAQWDKILPFQSNKRQLAAHLRDAHDFFRITQQIDTALTVAQICPVTILDVTRTDSATTVVMTPLDDAERTNLARNLGLQSPAEQLRDWFDLGFEVVTADDEDDPKRDSYALLDRRTVGSDTSSTLWRFVSAEPHVNGPRYCFRAQGLWPIQQGRLYLARNHGGTLAQIRRRHKAIEEMRSHEDLLQVIASPRDASRRGTDKLPSGRATIPLDESKLEALEEIWKTQPSFAVQGPPGTGKTTLIQAFVDRLFAADQTAQVLVTAHSHHTVEDVRKKLAKLFTSRLGSDEPILLRIGGDKETEHDLELVSASALLRLSKSQLVQTAPEHLKSRILQAATPSERKSGEADVDVRTMRVLVQDAANLTFSTSNSAELADLATRGRRFDWSIIEEAGKAHGFDMAIAMQESHRLLLMGDHYQLPPFNARVFKELLSDPLRIRKAVQGGSPFAPGLMDPSLVEEEEGRSSFSERCDLWRRMVTFFATMFEASRAQEGEKSGPAKTLLDHHRMHPDIAELVGKIFYPDGNEGTILRSPKETHAKFAEGSPFTIAEGSWLPQHRIVWCDVPWVQKDLFAPGEIEGLFASQAEVEAILAVLNELKGDGSKPCEVQILSPYNDQLGLIRRAIEKAHNRGSLPAMFDQPFDLRHGKRMGATVDQFQGSEADIVIVSLVRNNALVPRKSIGFLREKSRMNVLLSRARHKLIIVGSWDFFKTRCDEFTSPDEEYSYIGNMVREMQSAIGRGSMFKIEAPK